MFHKGSGRFTKITLKSGLNSLNIEKEIFSKNNDVFDLEIAKKYLSGTNLSLSKNNRSIAAVRTLGLINRCLYSKKAV